MLNKPSVPSLPVANKNKLSLYRHNEQGVALIVVLLILILIMLAGVIAVKQSNTDLKTATADQINTLLLQSADGANIKLENMVNGSAKSQTYLDVTHPDKGIFGYFSSIDNANDELVYCYNPRNLQVFTTGTTIYRNGGVLSGATGGICDPQKTDSYISARNTTLTQMSIRLAPAVAGDNDDYKKTPEGKDTNNTSVAGQNLQKNYSFEVRPTSVLPSYANKDSDITACLSKKPTATTTAAEEIRKCLGDKNIPKKQLFSQMDMDYTDGKIKCTKFALGDAGDSMVKGKYLSTKCTPKKDTTSNSTG